MAGLAGVDADPDVALGRSTSLADLIRELARGPVPAQLEVAALIHDVEAGQVEAKTSADVLNAASAE